MILDSYKFELGKMKKIRKICFCCFFSLCAAFSFAAANASLDDFEKNAKVGEEVIIKVRVTDTTLKKVNYSFAEPPAGARRMELKKYIDSQSAASDIIIESVFIFDKPGTFELPPLAVKIGKKTYNIEIPFIEVTENAKLKAAEVFWNYKADAAFAYGSPVELELKIRYVSSINMLDVPLDEQAAISRQTEPVFSFDENADFSDGITAAVYQWIPLESGDLKLPEAVLEVTGTNGEVQTIEAPEIYVNVAQQSAAKPVQENQLFASAFEPENQSADKKAAAQTSKNLKARSASVQELKPYLEKLAELRAKEHESIFNSNIKEQRKSFESQLDLHDTPDEYQQIFIIAWFVCAAVFLLWSLVLRISSSKFRSLLLFLVFALCLARGVYHAKEYWRTPALFVGGEVSTVPDTESLVAGELTPGTRICVANKVGDWILIEYNGRKMGWVNAETIVPINVKFIFNREK